METIRNLFFVAVVAVVLTAPAMSRHLIRPLPPSYLEGRVAPRFPELSIDAIVQGEAQTAFGIALAFGVPNRDETLLAHAKWQRAMIRVAAHLFGFDAYPTFYGSKYCRIDINDALAAIPGKFSPKRKQRLLEAARRYSVAMEKYSNIRWVFALVDRSDYSLTNPLRSLVNNPFDYDGCRKYFLAGLTKRCAVVDLGYKTLLNFYADFFRTDHHWRIQGAVRAYCEIAGALGIEPVQFEQSVPVTTETFFGTHARYGLDAGVTGDAIYDVVYKRSSLSVSVNGKEKPESFLDHGYTGRPYEQTTKFDSMYGGFFHNDVGVLRISNPKNSRALLLVGDSFALCMERFFAETYREVYRIDPRKTKLTLAEFLAVHHVDDALFLVSPGSAINPAFLDFL